MRRIAIIGAGLSGLVLAHRLKSRAKVTLFEKSRGVGGRMSRRYTDEYEFDHGAQYFVARSDRFRSYLQPFIQTGTIAPWHANFLEKNRDQTLAERLWGEECPHYVAVPGMNQLCKQLAVDLDVRLGTRISEIRSTGGCWQLVEACNTSQGEYDWVVSTMLSQQAAALLPESFAHSDQLNETKMLGCYALLLGLRTPLRLPWQAARIHQADISWISVNSSKPGRSGGFTLLAHAANTWSEQHMEDGTEDVKDHMVRELSGLIEHDLSNTEYCVAHRWRYANIEKQNGPTIYLDKDHSLAACGDWCIQGRVEAAFISATDLADELESLIQ